MRDLKDASFVEPDVALPNGNATTYSSDIDLGNALENGQQRPENFELLVSVPLLTVTHLPNDETLSVSIVAGAAASPTTVVLGNVLVSTGAGGSGDVAKEVKVRLPSNCPRYVRAKFDGSASAGDMSAVDAEVSLVF